MPASPILHSDLAVQPWTVPICEALQEAGSDAKEEPLLALNNAYGRERLLLPCARLRVVRIDIVVWLKPKIGYELRELRQREERKGGDFLMETYRVIASL